MDLQSAASVFKALLTISHVRLRPARHACLLCARTRSCV
jgi:hypothetical protein